MKDMQELIVQIDWLEHQLDQLKRLEGIAADERQRLRRIVAQLEEMDGRTIAECRMEIRRYINRIDEIEGSTAGLRNAISRAINAFEEAERLNKEEFEEKSAELSSGNRGGVSLSRPHRVRATRIEPFIPDEGEVYPFIPNKRGEPRHTPENEGWSAGLGIVAFELFHRWARIARWQMARPHFRNWQDGYALPFRIVYRRIKGMVRPRYRVLHPKTKVLWGAPKDVLFLCSARRLDVPEWLNERY